MRRARRSSLTCLVIALFGPCLLRGADVLVDLHRLGRQGRTMRIALGPDRGPRRRLLRPLARDDATGPRRRRRSPRCRSRPSPPWHRASRKVFEVRLGKAVAVHDGLEGTLACQLGRRGAARDVYAGRAAKSTASTVPRAAPGSPRSPRRSRKEVPEPHHHAAIDRRRAGRCAPASKRLSEHHAGCAHRRRSPLR